MSNVKPVVNLSNAQDITAAVTAFKAADGWGDEMSCMWQSIREAALEQFAVEHQNDPVPGSDSY